MSTEIKHYLYSVSFYAFKLKIAIGFPCKLALYIKSGKIPLKPRQNKNKEWEDSPPRS